MTSAFHFKFIGDRINESKDDFTDSLTGRRLCVPEADRCQVWTLVKESLTSTNVNNRAELADKISALMREGMFDSKRQASASWLAYLPSSRLRNARLVDRAFLCSAVACCLSDTDNVELLGELRLKALVDEFPSDLKKLVSTLTEKFPDISSETSQNIFACAQIVAADPLQWDGRNWVENGTPAKDYSEDDFKSHPLYKAGSIALVMGGAQHVKSYLFESARLPEIRGASSLLDYANSDILSGIYGSSGLFKVPECVVFAAGGTFLSFAPRGKMNQIADAVERDYGRVTLTASAAATTCEFALLELHYGLSPETPREGKGDKGRNFGEICNFLAGQVQERRAGTPQPGRMSLDLFYQPESHPFLERCTSCGQRPVAAITQPYPGEKEGRGICESCSRKALVGRYTKTDEIGDRYRSMTRQIHWSPNELENLESWPQLFRRYLEERPDLAAGYLANHEPRDVKAPSDLLDIAGRNGDIGLIYADGNNISRILSNVTTPAHYRELSERLFVSCRQAVFDALARRLTARENNLQKGNKTKALIHPFEILTIGGDDLMVIVPAAEALDIALDIANTFEHLWDSPDKVTAETLPSRYKESTDRQFAQNPRISLSVGVVIGDANTPIIYLRNLAEELLKSAKKLSRKTHTGVIDFQSLKAAGNLVDSISGYRREALEKSVNTIDGKKIKLRFTARPYSLKELDGLLKIARHFCSASIPRSQLYGLRTSLLTSKMRSTLEYLYMKKRASTPEANTMFEMLDKGWHSHNPAEVPWIKMANKDTKSNEYETVIPDIIEIMPYLSGSRRESVDATF